MRVLKKMTMLTLSLLLSLSMIVSALSRSYALESVSGSQLTSQPHVKPIATYTSVASAGKKVRKYFKSQKKSFSFYVNKASLVSTRSKANSTIKKIFKKAYAHTKVATEGDSLRWNIKSYSYTYMIYNKRKCKYKVTMKYRMNKSKAATTHKKCKALIKKLKLSGLTDYQKVKKIYDWMTKNISYDYDETHSMRYTPYNAIVKKSCVCEGYALLFYRLALIAKINSRFITGINSTHAWNIVKLNGKYYNLDATWDTNRISYNYFLKSNKNFTGHPRDKEYKTSSFNKSYKMSKSNYKAVTKITLNQKSFSMDPKDTYTLKATIKNASSPDKANLKWTTSNSKVAKVSSKGKVTAVATGTATITAKVGNIKGKCTVTVRKQTYKDISTKATIKFASNIYYTGYAITPNVTITYNGMTLRQGIDYQFNSISNNVKPGTATVKIQFIGTYRGSITKTFKIKLEPPVLNKPNVTDNEDGTKAVTFTWNAVSTADYYEYAASYDYDNLADTTYGNSWNYTNVYWSSISMSYKIYVKIRSVKVIDGKEYYSDWSMIAVA